jgi:HK97 family phage major capsid protein
MPVLDKDKDLDVSFTIPDDPDALLEVVSDISKVAEIISKHGQEGWDIFQAKVKAASDQKDRGESAEQIALQVETKIHEFLTEHGHEASQPIQFTPDQLDNLLDRNVAMAGRQSRRRGQASRWYDDRSPGAAIDKARIFSDTGEALQAIWAATVPAKAQGLANFTELVAKAGKVQEIQAAYSSHIGSSGGYLLPESFRAEMLEIAHESSVVRANGPTVIPMGTPKVSIPAIHETNRSSNLFGGVTIYWTEESAESTESEAAFKVVVLEPDTMTGYAEIPNETLMDSMASGAFFSNTFPKAMAFEEDYAFLQGSGVGEPYGILNAAAYLPVELESGQTTGVTYENVARIYSRMLPSSLARAVWVLNQDVLFELLTMGLVVGTGGGPMFATNAAPAMPMSLFGRPLVVTEKANALNTQGDISLLDIGFYLIGDLQTQTVASSEHYKFKQRRTAFSLVSRVDGQPWLESAITPRHGNNTLSPFVGITGTGRS